MDASDYVCTLGTYAYEYKICNDLYSYIIECLNNYMQQMSAYRCTYLTAQ